MAFSVASIEPIAPPWAWQLNANRDNDDSKKNLDDQHLASFLAKSEASCLELHLLVQRLNALIKFDVSFPSSSRLKGSRLSFEMLTARARFRPSGEQKDISIAFASIDECTHEGCDSTWTTCLFRDILAANLNPFDTAAVLGKSMVLRWTILRSTGCFFPSGLLSE